MSIRRIAMSEDKIKEVEQEIEDAVKKQAVSEDDFQIEVTDQDPEQKQPEQKELPLDDVNYGAKVQKRIKKLISERKAAEQQTAALQEQNAQFQSRLERLERGNQHQAENNFQQRYNDTKAALTKAVEEGDTEAQVNFSEQLADMRAAIRVNEMQQRQMQRVPSQPKTQRQPVEEEDSNPPPKKAMTWWRDNEWFNSAGFERETAAARAIDVQLDLEGHDKESSEYYEELNNRLRKVYPELISPKVPKRAKSRSPVAPTAGGSNGGYKGNRVRLTQDQLRMARELGITDEVGLKKYEAEVRNQTRRNS